MKYYNIDENIACTAHGMVHMSDYVPNSATNSYRAAVDKAAALVEERKAKVSNYYHEKLDSILDCYSRRLAEWTNAYNRNQASYPSQFIAGSSGYNMKKHNKQMSREDTLWQEYSEIQDLLNKMKTIGTGAVDLADPHAREILTEQLQQLRCKLEQCKALNAYYRKHQSFVDFPNMSADAAEKLTAEFNETRSKCPWIDKPCPDYELTSLRGKIKRVQARLDELDKLDAARVTQTDAIVFAGGEIVKNAELNRLQIIFHEIPDEDTRATLKSNGFRWSPSNQAWQRQLTQSAENAARRILGCEGKGGCNA